MTDEYIFNDELMQNVKWIKDKQIYYPLTFYFVVFFFQVFVRSQRKTRKNVFKPKKEKKENENLLYGDFSELFLTGSVTSAIFLLIFYFSNLIHKNIFFVLANERQWNMFLKMNFIIFFLYYFTSRTFITLFIE